MTGSLAEKKKWDVLALGNVAIDDLLYVESYPQPDSKVQVLRRQRQCGGLAATALVAAARLGANCAYAGALGEDDASNFVEATLAKEGVDVTSITKRPDAGPTHSFIVVGKANHTRNIFYEVNCFCGADDHTDYSGIVAASRVLLIDRWGESGMIKAAQSARQQKVPVISDIESSDFDGFEKLFALVDHPILSEGFACILTGESTPTAAAKALWNDTRKVVVVTMGANGCVAVTSKDTEPIFVPAFSVPVVDTTGCGDVFHGAYAAGLAQGLDLPQRLRLACAAAALKATQPGGQMGIPRKEDVDLFLSEETS